MTSATESVVHALASTVIDADAPAKQTARMPPMINADRRRPTTTTSNIMVSGVEGFFEIDKYNTTEKAVVCINRPAIGGFEKCS